MKVELVRDADNPATYQMAAMNVGDWAVIASSLSDDDYSKWIGCPVHRIAHTKNGMNDFSVHFSEEVIYIHGDDFLVRNLDKKHNERIVITNRE